MSGDATGDATGGVSGDGRWMTYTELARVRGISKSSAERLVFRNHWRRPRGNNGVTRALVPLDSLTGDTTGTQQAICRLPKRLTRQ